MARVDSRTLFLTTSPRTPAKMIPEISLLIEHFEGQPWNNETQERFMNILKDENFFNAKGQNDPAFSARDRIIVHLKRWVLSLFHQLFLSRPLVNHW